MLENKGKMILRGLWIDSRPLLAIMKALFYFDPAGCENETTRAAILNKKEVVLMDSHLSKRTVALPPAEY
jgi:hypothetical protein